MFNEGCPTRFTVRVASAEQWKSNELKQERNNIEIHINQINVEQFKNTNLLFIPLFGSVEKLDPNGYKLKMNSILSTEALKKLSATRFVYFPFYYDITIMFAFVKMVLNHLIQFTKSQLRQFSFYIKLLCSFMQIQYVQHILRSTGAT